ncbi:hypothetical protein BASA81_002009 [Batrachochytrium salamandrivorans]|nr:hypothetical protein BASA81_002009 [Batrachochytrium salamandrivorans]
MSQKKGSFRLFPKAAEQSEFESWPVEELVFRLREDGVDVPPDSNPHDLVGFATAFYAGSHPRRYTVAEVEFVDHSGVEYVPRPKPRTIHKPIPEHAAPYQLAPPLMFKSEMTPQELGRFQEMQFDEGITSVEDEIDTVEHFGEDEHTRMIRENFLFIEEEDATMHRIKSEFQKPNVEVAKRFETLNHPRRADGKKYSVFCTNTGRFCFTRGRGWLLRFVDPLLEGNTSELAKYGIGVSLHFKILKWLFWTFLLLTVISIPQMTLNHVAGSRSSSILTLDGTTLGHLAVDLFFVNETSQSVVRRYTTLPIEIPYFSCGQENFTSSCLVDRETVAMFYTCSDLVSMAIFFLGIKWMRYFVRVEGAKITKHHITVEEYTIQVVRVPPTTTEMQLKKFFSDLTGEPVHEVFLVQDNGELLSLYVKRGKVINKLWKQAAEVHLLKEERRSKPGQRKAIMNDKTLQHRLQRAVRQYDKTYALFLDLNEQRSKKSPGTKSLGAFVTFETQQGFLKAMDLYPQSYWQRYKQPVELRLEPKKPLKWYVFFTERERYQLKSAIVDNSCGVLESAGNASVYALAQTLTLLQAGDVDTELLARNDTELRNCYCSSMNFGEAVSSLFTMDGLCHSYYSIKSPQYALTFVATLVIAIINISLQQAIYMLSIFEKHHSLVNMELSIAKRAFVVIFINTGLILLCVNARLDGVEWIGSGRFGDFVPDWYPSVGTNIVLTMTLNSFTPQLFPFIRYSLHKSRQRTHVAYSQRELNEMYLGDTFLLSYRTAQISMTVFVTLLYSSGMPCLYPIACGTFMVTYYSDKFLLLHYYRTPPAYSERLALWFSDLMPYAIMFHLGFAVWMFSTEGIFWDGITYQASTLAEYFGVTNLTFADSATEAYNFGPRLSMSHIVPLYAALFLMILFNLLSFLFHSVDRIRAMCCAAVTCGIFDDGVIKRRYLNPDYTDAVEGGQLRGLVNYNILENPTYSRALGIDAKFAQEHRHVASVHEASAVDLPVLPNSFKVIPAAQLQAEEDAAKRNSLDQRRRNSLAEEKEDSQERPNSNRHSARVAADSDGGDGRDRGDSRAQQIDRAFFRGSVRLEEAPPAQGGGGEDVNSRQRARTASVAGAGRDRMSLGRVFTPNFDD